MNYSENEKFLYTRYWNYILIHYIIFLVNTLMHFIIVGVIAISSIMVVLYDYDEPIFIITQISLVAIMFLCLLTIKYNYDTEKLADTFRRMCQ